MKKIAIILSSCFIFSIATVFFLYALTEDPLAKYASFTRIFPDDVIAQSRIQDIKFNSYYISGGTKEHIYLANVTAPLHLLKMNTTSTDTQHVNLVINSSEKVKLRAPYVRVEEPNFYITDGRTPAILKGNIRTWTASRYMYDSTFFTESTPLSPFSFAIRTMSGYTGEYVLGKQKSDAPHIQFFDNLLEKQIDGIFCTDGILHYNKDIKRLVYLYYYRNQYVCMDTNLNVLYRGNTIDTLSHVKIKTGKIKSENSFTMSSPPLVVNKRGCVSGDWLFVNSNLMAKNENIQAYKNGSVIDVYDLIEGSYKLSFYIPQFGQQKLQDFKIFGNTLAVLYGKHVILYKLDRRHFQKEENFPSTLN